MKYQIGIVALAVACGQPGAESTFTGLERPSTIPEWAEEIAPDVFSLGEDVDPVSGEDIEGLAFVTREPGMVDEEVAVDDDLSFDSELAARGGGCYALIGFPGWIGTEPWGVGVTQVAGVQQDIETAQALWETASGADIFGSYRSANTGIARTTADGENNIQFGNAGGGGTVAVTYVWGSRRTAIFEWDQIYGSNWAWSTGGSSSSFAFLSVAAHEVGHAAGMDHPRSTCTQETMFAYVDYGETFQQDLNTGDIAGIQTLY